MCSSDLFRLNPTAPEFPAITLANTEEVTALGDRLIGVRLVVLHFPKFTDGRAYSQARQLRERLGYTDELRATGVVLRDASKGKFVLPPEAKIAAGARLIVGASVDPAKNGGVPVTVEWVSGITLGNATGAVVLDAGGGVIVDAVAWDVSKG